MPAPQTIKNTDMKKWKKTVTIIVALIVLAAAYGAYLYNKKPADVRKLDAQVAISAPKLVEAFNKDETAANKLYLDKIIAVKGSISDIKTDSATKQSTVFLDSGDPLAAVNCSFYEEESAAVQALQKGQQVTIKGQCTGKLLDVVLNKCSIVP